MTDPKSELEKLKKESEQSPIAKTIQIQGDKIGDSFWAKIQNGKITITSSRMV